MTFQDLCDNSKYFKVLNEVKPRFMDWKQIKAYRVAKANWKREVKEFLSKQ